MRSWAWGVVWLLLALVGEAARAEKRVALVVGCGLKYQDRALVLRTPPNDVAGMEALLKEKLGFGTVLTAQEATREEVFRQLAMFQAEVRKQEAEVALFFYSGHGIEYEGENYLIPVDATLEEAFQLKTQAVALEEVLKALKESGAAARVAVLDCCRNNPFLATKGWLAGRTKAVGREADELVLAQLGEAGTPETTLVAYAASPGRKALSFLDAGAPNSAYTEFLLKHLPTPGLPLRDVFERAHDALIEATKGRQAPLLEYDQAARVLRTTVLVPGKGEEGDEEMAGWTPGSSLVAPNESEPKASDGKMASGVGSSRSPDRANMPESVPAASTVHPATHARLSGVARPTVPALGYFSKDEVFVTGSYAGYSPYGRQAVLTKVQNVLKQAGFYPKEIDGRMGKSTQEGLFQWQEERGVAVTGTLDDTTLGSMSLLGLPDERSPSAPEVTGDRVNHLRGLVGRWVRQDEEYRIEILRIFPNGQVEARYHNPVSGYILVEDAYLLPEGGRRDFFMKLDRVNYGGSEYFLSLQSPNQLKGEYHYEPTGEGSINEVDFDRK